MRAQRVPARVMAAASCDRTCLEGFVDRYLDALLAHDPGRLPVTREVRFTENGQQLALHLAIRDHRIAEIETLVSRLDLVRIANLYFSGMQQNDGKGVYPFAKDCNRIENGTFTTDMPTPRGQTRPDPRTARMYSAQWSCLEQFQSGLIRFVTRIRDRRFVAVDPQRGIVFAFGFFDHSAGATRTFQTPDGRTVTAGPQQPWTWEIAEVFQIRRSRIHQIMAIMNHVEYGMSSGWSTWEDGLSSRARYLGPTF